MEASTILLIIFGSILGAALLFFIISLVIVIKIYKAIKKVIKILLNE